LAASSLALFPLLERYNTYPRVREKPPPFVLKLVYEDVLPLLEREVILICGHHDHQIPGTAEPLMGKAPEKLWRALLEHPMVSFWFAENADKEHPKFAPMPLGMNCDDFTKASGCDELASAARRDADAWPGLYEARNLTAFRTDRVRNGEGYYVERKRVWELCDSDWADVCFSNPMCSRPTSPARERKRKGKKIKVPAYYNCMDLDAGLVEGQSKLMLSPRQITAAKAESHAIFARYAKELSFLLCPHGAGMDPSPKVWEALAFGAIPIIKNSTTAEPYKNLPVVMVEDWAPGTLTKQRLQRWKAALKHHFVTEEGRKELFFRLSEDFWWDVYVPRRAAGDAAGVEEFAIRASAAD